MTSPVGDPNYLPKRRVAILTAATLSRNPRAFKEAKTAARAGFETVVYGASFDAGARETDEALADRYGFSFKSVVPVGEDGRKPELMSVWRRGWYPAGGGFVRSFRFLVFRACSG